MPGLQIPDLDQATMSLLRQWAADHGRTVEDEVRLILQSTVAQAKVMSSDRGATPAITDVGEFPIGEEAGLSRGAASLQPMTLSTEDAVLMQEAWEQGLARPKIAIAPLPQYEG